MRLALPGTGISSTTIAILGQKKSLRSTLVGALYCKIHDFLNGPSLLSLWLSAHIYWACLEEVLQKLLGSILLAIRRDMWFHDDGAASPFTRHVRKLLTATYSDYWIRQGGPVVWLPS